LADVALDDRSLAARGADFLGHPAGTLLVGAVVDPDRPAVGGEQLRGGGADPARGAGDEGAALAALAHASVPHSTTVAPQVRPAPKAAIRTRAPLARPPASRASSSATGIEAAEVLPNLAMQSRTRAGSGPSRSPTERRIRALAWR